MSYSLSIPISISLSRAAPPPLPPQVCLLRASGIPVVVSMGGVAASGGYYMACPADAILASPATITGSIGVLGGKLVLGGFLESLGESWGSGGGRGAQTYREW